MEITPFAFRDPWMHSAFAAPEALLVGILGDLRMIDILFFLMGGWLIFPCAGRPSAFWAPISEESWCSTEPGDHPTNSLNQGLSSRSGSVCGPPGMPWPHCSSAPWHRHMANTKAFLLNR